MVINSDYQFKSFRVQCNNVQVFLPGKFEKKISENTM